MSALKPPAFNPPTPLPRRAVRAGHVYRAVLWLVALAAAMLATRSVVAQVSPSARPGPRREQLSNFDRRNAAAATGANAVTGASPASDNAVTNLRRSVPNVRVDRDSVVGAPSFVRASDRFLAGPSGPVAGNPQVQGQPNAVATSVVSNFIDANQGLFGHNSSVLSAAQVRREFVTRHNGLRTIIWEQQLDHIGIFEATLHAHVTARGELVNVASRLVADPARAVQRSAASRTSLTNSPPIGARDALVIAGRNLGEQFTAAQVNAIDVPVGPERRQKFRTAALTDAEARYTWLPMDANNLRLCWEVICTSRARAEMFRLLIDAETGEPLVRHRLTEYISDASYRVFTSDSPSPFSPGHPTPLTTQPPLVARTLVTTSALNTTASPNGWIDDGVIETRGNNVDAHTDVNADNSPDLPRPQATGAGRVFDPALDLTQAPSTYRDAAVVNLFYWCNFMHDKLYELGFDEASGNFQNNNFGRGGLGNDAVQADAQDGSGTNNANFSTAPDGSPGRMQMYVFDFPTPARDGDFDAEIILHEYTHGLSNRLVGGGVGISALASRGMGEGWSDFYGLALLSAASDDINGNYAAGGYATYQLAGLTSNYYFGIRRYPYSTNMTKNPLTFRDIDPSQASSHSGIPISPIIGSDPSEVHCSGEVWCVTLWDMRANLVSKHGFTIGNQLALQLVTDGMKLSPANPNFLQARDAILQADLVTNAGANRGEIWAAFAKRGMGANATAPNSSTTTGVVESYDLPDALGVGPSDLFSATGNVGGPFTPVSRTYTLTNSSASAVNWTVATNVTWLSLSSTGGTLAAGANTTVVVSFTSAAGALSIGTYSGTVTFRNTGSGIAQPRSVQLEVQPFTVAILTEDFESGTLDPARWTVSGTGTYRTQNTTANGPHGGTRHLTMENGADSGVYARNEATLTVNLAGQRDVILKFWARMWDDDPDGPPASPFQTGADFDGVAISADGVNWYEVQPLRYPTLTNSWTQFTVDLDAAIAARGLSYNSTFKIRFNQYDNFAIPTDGIAIDDIVIARVYTNQLSFNVASAVNENASPITATITASPVSSSALTVNLTSSLPGTLSVPATVTIAAGQASANITVTPVDDTVLNGTRSVTVTGTAAGWGSAVATVNVNDNEAAVLGVTLPATIAEGAAAGTGTVAVSAAPASAVTVQLTNSDAASLVVPSTVTIPAGQTSATFSVLAVDDTKINGTRSVTVTASVANWTSGVATVSVLDNESTALSLTVAASMREGDTGTTGTVRIAGTLTSNLTVSLSSDDTTELTVPSTITIPAGSTSATFAITVVDDTLADGPQTVHLAATAGGFTGASATVVVADNDAHHFAVSAISSPQVRGAPIAVSVTAQDVSNNPITNYNSTISLSAASGGTGVTVTPTTASGFVNGVWTGNVTIGTFANNVVLTASDGGGHAGSSNAFDVVTGPFHHFAWGGFTSPQTVDTPFNVTLTAQDIGNNTVPFNGTVNLGVQTPTTVEILSWVKYSDMTSTGEYENTKRAISSFFTDYHETNTTVTDPAALATALAGKHVFVIPEQELVSSGTMGGLGTSWATVLNNFVNAGGTVIACSYTNDEHLVLVNSGLMAATKTTFAHPLQLTKTTDTVLNAGVATPFTGSYISQYSAVNGVVSLESATGAQPVVISRAVGSGRAIIIGTDYFTIGTGMDRIIANAISSAQSGSMTVPIRPTSANIVNGSWSGSISIPVTGNGLKLATTTGGVTTTGTSLDVGLPPPPATGGATVFTEDFESGTFSSAWSITGTGNYRTQIISTWSPHGGTRHMTMDEALDSGVYARNEATLTVNLAGRSGVTLSFWAAQYGDEYDGPPASPFPGSGANFDGVAISADGGNNWYEIQPFSTLLYQTYSQFTLNLDAALAARGLGYTSNFKIRFNQYDNFSLGTDGIGIDDILITANPLGSTFALALPATATEGSTSTVGTIQLPSAATSNVTFSLASSAPAKAIVPATVVVPAGQGSVSFAITLPDDTLLDGNRNVTISASATGYQPANAVFTVIDNDAASLSLNIPPTATEGDGSIQGSVTVSPVPAGTFTINLTSSVTAAATVPSSITVLPGQGTVSFPITIIDDGNVDGTQTTVITATLPGATAATASLAVVDNDGPFLAVTPTTAYKPTGFRGGPFVPASQSYTLSNPGSGAINWTAAKSASWLDLSPTSGALAPGASTTVTVTPNATAGTLPTGTQTDSVVFTNTTNGAGNTSRSVELTVNAAGELDVSPAVGLTPDGPVGGPFSPLSTSWTLTNTGDAALAWSATKSQPWVSVSPTGGTLAVGGNATVTATINSAANALPMGIHHDAVLLTNTQTGRGSTYRPVDITVRPLAPVLAPEPAATGGAANTVSWGALSGNYQYEVQTANNPGFTSPVASGWLSGTSYTFSPLAHGQTWNYRVRGRVSAVGVSGSWSQTTQAEFDTGTKTNTTSVAPGDVILGPAPGTPMVGRIQNSSFEVDPVGSSSITSWPRTTSGFVNASTGNSAVGSPLPTAGAAYAFLWTDWTSHSVGEYGKVTQTVDFTGGSQLAFDSVLTASNGIYDWVNAIRAEVRIDNTTVWSSTVFGSALNQTVNLANWSGSHVLELRCEVTAAGGYDPQWACFDNLRVLAPAGYQASGTLVSPVIAPAPFAGWGVLQFTKDVSAAGTALTVDVLDATGNLLAANVTSGTHLGGLPSVAGQPALKLRANLFTAQSANTPRLLDWSIAYVNTVPFTIETPWSAVVSSLQDAVGPVVALTSPGLSNSATYTLVGTATDDGAGVNTLTVNGVAASTSTGFANWNAAATLVPGSNSFTLVAADRAVPANVALTTFNVVYNPPGAPVINTHPQATTAKAGDAAAFTVTVTGAAPLTYQWWKGATAIAGATNATLSLANVQSGDGGSYTVVVSNSLGAVTSNPATLTVILPPTITAQPQPKTVAVGQAFSFGVGVSGTAPLVYQWRKNGTDIAGAANPTFGNSSAVAGDAGNYSVVVTNAAGTATSSPASLTVLSTGAYATHAMLGGGYLAGDTVTIDNTVVYASATAGVTWQAVLPAGWSFASSSGSDGDTRPAPGATGTIQWTWTTVPANPVRFSYKLNVPSGTTGAKTVAALVDVVQSGGTQHLLADPDPLGITPVVTHSADVDQDFYLSLVELTRVIELYNTRNGSTRTGCYAVQSGTEDGFIPDPARTATTTVTLARYHSADSNHDGKVSLFELTRAIELYNYRTGTTRTGQYHVQAGTEDGYASGP